MPAVGTGYNWLIVTSLPVISLLLEELVGHEPLISGIVGKGLRADDEEHSPAGVSIMICSFLRH
jgi:hypothetical protein